MCNKLFALCQLQLGSIVEDLERSVGGVNAAAGRLLQEAGSQASAEVRAIVMGLQFHDELNQRLQHVQTLLHLLAEQDPSADADDSAQLLARVSGIFSSRAEFHQLGKLFPGAPGTAHGDAVELF